MKIRKIIAILLIVCFVVSLAATTVSAIERKYISDKSDYGNRNINNLVKSRNPTAKNVQFQDSVLSDVGDDSQLANVDLQNVLQHQQQMLSEVASVSKMMYDQQLSSMRKIGG
jgi:hypothetical protein